MWNNVTTEQRNNGAACVPASGAGYTLGRVSASASAGGHSEAAPAMREARA